MSQKIQFQETDHGPLDQESSPSEETPGRTKNQNTETPKKPIPVVLPVLPILPTPKPDPISMNKTVREKPRERERCPRYLFLIEEAPQSAYGNAWVDLGAKPTRFHRHF